MIGIQLKVTCSYSQVGSRYVQTNALHILSRIRDRGRLDGDVDPKRNHSGHCYSPINTSYLWQFRSRSSVQFRAIRSTPDPAMIIDFSNNRESRTSQSIRTNRQMSEAGDSIGIGHLSFGPIVG